MRLLLDECVPRRLARDITGHDASHVRDLGWSGKSNGELLALMGSNGFAALVTVDQNLPFQQNLAGSRLAVVILIGRSNRLQDLRAVVPALLAALGSLPLGQVTRVGG